MTFDAVWKARAAEQCRREAETIAREILNEDRGGNFSFSMFTLSVGAAERLLPQAPVICTSHRRVDLLEQGWPAQAGLSRPVIYFAGRRIVYFQRFAIR